MIFRAVIAAATAAALVAVPATRVQADAGDFVAGAIVGGVVGHALTKQNQQRRTSTQRYYKPSLPSTQEGRVIQSSLNYFGFNAGTVDGQLGRQSRSAIANYQAYMGYPASGELSPFEYDLLVTSYNRAQAGGYATSQAAAQNPDGVRGLLKTYRAEMAGMQVPQGQVVAPGTTVVVNPQPAAPAPATTMAVAPEAPAASGSGLPNFMGSGAQLSLASHCNTVSLVTNTNGGFTKVDNMVDANFALNEQFCLARTYAIAQGEGLVSKVSGFTPQQIEAQCASFAPAMKDQVAALSLKTQAEVLQDVGSFILGTGMSPAQVAGTARICLGVGYRTDNMDVALGSALLLVALGEGVYGELIGHHLAQGFGTAKRVDKAMAWFETGLQAADGGATAAFVPGQPERNDLIRKAVMQVGGGQDQAGTMTAPVQPASASGLPVFKVNP